MIKALSSLFKSAGTSSIPHWKGRAPEGTTIFVIGDVHGYDDALAAIYDQIDQQRAQIQRDSPNQKFIEISMSDVTDRGERTRETLDLMISRYKSNKESNMRSVYVAADHEALLQELLKETTRMTSKIKGFFDNGGLETLRSYDVTPRISHTPQTPSAHRIHGTNLYVHYEEVLKMREELWQKIPMQHAHFLRKAVPMVHLGSYVFVHGGIDPALPVDMKHQDINVVTGISSKSRKFAEYDGPIIGDHVIVRGHTISRRPVLTHNQIGIDTGIYLPGGKLTCATLQGSEVAFVQAETRLPPYNLALTAKRAQTSSDQIGPISSFAPLD